MPYRLGRFTLHEIRDGFLRVDGGVVFGPVPRSQWALGFPPDEQNRIRLAVRCLLVDTGTRVVLIDDGLGQKPPPGRRALYAVEAGAPGLDAELARAGFSREDVTDVILTHLHSDHAGGTTRLGPDGSLTLAFPNATFHLQRRQIRWAHRPSERDAECYCREDFALLEQTGQLHLVEGETELFEGLEIFVSEGHTVGLQLVRVRAGDEEVIFCGDLIPTRAHLKPHFGMACDLYPLTVIEERKMLLAQAVEDAALLFFEHDPEVAACRVREEDGEVVASEPVAF